MTIKTLTPAQAREKLRTGATLVDIRESDEHAREHIADALHCPLGDLDARDLGNGTLIFHCRSGNRTTIHASRLAAKGPDVFLSLIHI